MAISNKVKEGRFKIFSDFKINKSKTSLLISKLQKLNIDSALFIDGDTLEKSFLNAVRNVPKMDFLPAAGINVYDIVKRDFLVLSENALGSLIERFKK